MPPARTLPTFAALLLLAGLAGRAPGAPQSVANLAATPETAIPAPLIGSDRTLAPDESTPDASGLGFFHPLQSPGQPLRSECASIPAAERDHVYVFFINGADPLCVGNLNGLCAYIKSLGFNQCEFGQMYHTRSFYRKICKIKAGDPQAKFVVFGYSLGANCALMLTHWLKDDGVNIDLLVYLGADMVYPGERSRPDNAMRIMNIMGHGSIWFGGDLFIRDIDMDGAQNLHLDAGHFSLPSQAETITSLVQEIINVANRPAGMPQPDETPPVPAVRAKAEEPEKKPLLDLHIP